LSCHARAANSISVFPPSKGHDHFGPVGFPQLRSAPMAVCRALAVTVVTVRSRNLTAIVTGRFQGNGRGGFRYTLPGQAVKTLTCIHCCRCG
jgi:hypothetical protein